MRSPACGAIIQPSHLSCAPLAGMMLATSLRSSPMQAVLETRSASLAMPRTGTLRHGLNLKRPGTKAWDLKITRCVIEILCAT